MHLGIRPFLGSAWPPLMQAISPLHLKHMTLCLPHLTVRQNPAVSLLALHVRQGNVSSARSLWIMLNTVGQATPDMVQPTAMYAVALLKSGNVEEGLHEARNMFTRIRNASSTLRRP